MDEGLRHLERRGLQDPVARVRHLMERTRAGQFNGKLHISGFLFPEETFCGASGWSDALSSILFRELPALGNDPIVCQSCRRTDAFKAYAGQADSIKNRNSRWFWKHHLKQAKENGLLP